MVGWVVGYRRLYRKGISEVEEDQPDDQLATYNNRIKVAVAPVPDSTVGVALGRKQGPRKSSADNKVVNNIHLIKENKAKAEHFGNSRAKCG